jgi:TrmH family RNA methyltransferase
VALSQARRALLRRLGQRKGREREGLVLVEGIRAVEEVLDAGVSPELALVAPRLRSLEGGSQLDERIGCLGAPVEHLDDRQLREVADTDHPQGVLLVCRQPDDPGLPRKPGLYLVLDAVQDPGNVGTLVRAAVAFGLDRVIALDGTADPWGTKAVRASTGLVFRIGVTRQDADPALAALEGAGVPVLVADPEGQPVGHRREASWALVIGNEGGGVRPTVAVRASGAVRVPMRGPAESLNAAVAGAILMYALTSEVGRA